MYLPLASLVLALLSTPPAHAAAPEKVWICHGTASEVRPYNLIHVKESDVEGHLDGTAPGNHGEDNEKNPDFLWDVEAFDADCLPIAEDPLRIWSSCGGQYEAEDLLAVTFDANGDATTDALTCPSVHGTVELPTGTTHIECSRGTAGSPYWHAYYLEDLANRYGVNCVAGNVANLGIQGGPFQLECPAQGYVELTTPGIWGDWEPEAFQCTPGTILPNAGSSFPDATTGWTDGLSWYRPGFVRCPADGLLRTYFTHYGELATKTDVFTTYACTPGQDFDLTTVVAE